MSPLSDREQRILEEIERNLYAEEARSPSGARRGPVDPSSRLKAGIAAFVIGFATLIAFFLTQVVLVGVAAFGLMVAGIVVIAGALPGAVGRPRQQGAPARARFAARVKHVEQRLRDRYRKGS